MQPKRPVRTLRSNSSRAEPPTKEVAKQKKHPFTPVGPKLLKLIRVLPPPANPNKGVVRKITMEMRAMLAEQEEDGPSICGYYFDPVGLSLALSLRYR